VVDGVGGRFDNSVVDGGSDRTVVDRGADDGFNISVAGKAGCGGAGSGRRGTSQPSSMTETVEDDDVQSDTCGRYLYVGPAERL
jgi:hypothetical protein